MQIKVYYEDTDCGGIVYHSNYLNFCERARSELFFRKGLTPHNKDNFFVVKKLKANYIKPAIFGDDLNITTKLVQKKLTSLILEQDIFRKDEHIFNLKVLVVYLENMKPAKIPQNLMEIFCED